MPGPERAAPLPDPALTVLVGASGAGKSSWAQARYRSAEIVSSDALREVVGSGPGDLDASVDAFDVLDRIVAARASRGLTVVVDTLGLDRSRRLGFLALARAAGLPAVLVVLDTPARLCRERNAARDRPVPAQVLRRQLASVAGLDVDSEGWDRIIRVGTDAGSAAEDRSMEPRSIELGSMELGSIEARSSEARPPEPPATRTAGLEVVLQVSRFDWGGEPGPWLRRLVEVADEVGLHGVALMDHLIQIPQVGRAWEPIPEPWVTLGFLAGTGTSLRLGTLVSPVTFRAPGIIAKTAATLDALAGGPTFCGLGAGWWAREHAAYALDFPAAGERLDQLETCIETVRALWAPGTKSYDGVRVELPETTCYPRPTGHIPIIVGGAGERRTLRIVAEHANGCNFPADEAQLARRLEILRGHCDRIGRDPAEVEITVLDVPVIGRDRDDVARRVERLRGRTAAPTYANRHHAGTAVQHAERYRRLAEAGVDTIFLALPDLSGPDDVAALAPLLTALR